MPLTLTGASGNSTLNSSTGLAIATWTTGTRPSSPVTGQVGYNTTTGQLEIFNTVGGWVNAGTTGIQYTANYLVIAGGGGGGGSVVVGGSSIPPPPPPPEFKRAVHIENYILKDQYDNLISFTGNGGGSEVRLNRVSAYLQPTVGATISSFAPLAAPSNAPASYTFNQSLTSHTRQEIADKVWKKTVSFDESRWDTSWVQSNFEQALAVWEYDNTNSRTFFNGQLQSTLMQSSFPSSLVSGSKSYSVGVASNHPPIRHLRISRQNYFSQARVNTGFGFRTGQSCYRSDWSCHEWNDFSDVPPHFYSVPSPLSPLWPAYEVHWDTKSGAVFGWTWPYRVYYVGIHPTLWY